MLKSILNNPVPGKNYFSFLEHEFQMPGNGVGGPLLSPNPGLPGLVLVSTERWESPFSLRENTIYEKGNRLGINVYPESIVNGDLIRWYLEQSQEFRGCFINPPFLLEVDLLAKNIESGLIFKGEGVSYFDRRIFWSGTPNTESEGGIYVRVCDSFGTRTYIQAYLSAWVCPAFVLPLEKLNLCTIASGDGTEENPYVINFR